MSVVGEFQVVDARNEQFTSFVERNAMLLLVRMTLRAVPAERSEDSSAASRCVGSKLLGLDTTQSLVRGEFKFGEFSFDESTNAAMQGGLRNGPKLKRESYRNRVEARQGSPR
jgi:hypothetical protein